MAAGKLDTETYLPFLELLEACQDYAELSGCRFLKRDFRKEESEGPVGAKPSAMQEAVCKAALKVEEFTKRVLAREEALRECVERAHRFVMTESVRAGIVATCREVGMWPPEPKPSEVPDDDCSFQDTMAPLAIIAQRAFNDEARRSQDALLQPLLRRATTASFLVDFVTEAGLPPPTLSNQHYEMLEEFMSRVDEWMGNNANVRNAGSPAPLAREALLRGLSYGGATAEAARQQVMARWSKNWETPTGTLLNVAAAGLAIAAGIAAMKRASRPRA
eukprot:TRINITY_DN79833_c0_g1_i1.p1 TRINITY_DN79833_c0_g1~~TRINITY_DN79833_c0_g1_i1.p1  ORF type:complete len:276 (-),score=48.37 TRINITY_DN79833_c0_g1_i1:31-858(-)